MNTLKSIFKIILPLGFIIILFQGCYTQVATVRDEDTASYKYDEEQPNEDYDSDNNSDYYSDDYDNWRPRHYIGFTYYYPGWSSYWTWDYGCVYPYYWDTWYWGPVYYTYYSYYPYYWHHWYGYSGYAYYSYGGYDYSSRYYTTRNSGYQRGGNVTRDYGTVRTGNSTGTGTRSIRDNSTTSTRGDVALPRTAGTTLRDGSSGTVNSPRTRPTNRTEGVSTGRTSRNYQPDVQQPRHRTESGEQSRENSNSSTRRGGYSRGSSGNSNSGSSERSSAPSYSPPPQRTSPPPSAPAPSSRGGESRGGDSRGGDSGGRSRR